MSQAIRPRIKMGMRWFFFATTVRCIIIVVVNVIIVLFLNNGWTWQLTTFASVSPWRF